jgi:hypothetical protein
MEEGWNFTPILVPLIALLIGWAIGFFDSNRRTAKKIKQAEDTAAIKMRDAENMIAGAQAKLAEASIAPYSVDDPGLMRIKNENGNLTLDLDGTHVNPTALTAEQRKRLIEMLTAIRPWLEGRPAIAPVSMLATSPEPKPLSAPIAPPPPQPVIQESAATPKASSSKTKKADEPELPPTSIVGQINLILQAQIINTPLAYQGVTLVESPSGGVNVYVGVDKYEGVDEVPDEGIKVAIRAAIAEWEKKYTPGL